VVDNDRRQTCRASRCHRAAVSIKRGPRLADGV
jgi:hypothetical protein